MILTNKAGTDLLEDSEEDIRAAFQVFDKDGSGFVSISKSTPISSLFSKFTCEILY